MEISTVWYLIIGALFTIIGAFQYSLKRLPLTTAMLYLTFGIAIGAQGFGLLSLDALDDAEIIERLSEVVVIISLFTAGLKLRLPLRSANWIPAFRLATVSMIVTISLIACFAVFALGFSWGAAILLGAILAPTDPVLAAAVQVRGPKDSDPMRFCLTGEAGLNDGTAFPFVMLGLGLLGLHDIGDNGLRWLLVDVVWQTVGGITSGAVLGTVVAHSILWLRKRHKESAVLDDFLTVGLICLSYGLALSIHSYGFLAVFAAGLALRRTERLHTSRETPGGEATDAGPDSQAMSAQMARAVLTFNEQLERLGEVSTVILVGALLKVSFFTSTDLWILPVLFLIIRPIAVVIGLFRLNLPRGQRAFMSWFGIRGIGSVYYLSYAVAHGLPDQTSQRLNAIVLAIIAVSILIHGVSVNPLMEFYQSKTSRPK